MLTVQTDLWLVDPVDHVPSTWSLEQQDTIRACPARYLHDCSRFLLHLLVLFEVNLRRVIIWDSQPYRRLPISFIPERRQLTVGVGVLPGFQGALLGPLYSTGDRIIVVDQYR